jgi:hypothetical protein
MAVRTASSAAGVVADDTGEPVPNARITVPSVPNALIVRSDRDGRFEILVPAGGFRIAISKSGYVRREVARPAFAFDNVAPGDYIIRANRGRSGEAV